MRTRPAWSALFRSRFRSLSRSGRRALRASSRRALRALLDAPLPIQFLVGAVVILAVGVVLNGVVQVIRKPTEMFFPVSGTLAKAPPETWRRYGPLFREHSTAVLTPDLLAALAQVEGAGNPVARTYWRWRLTWNPLELYRPASSAVGMYQITNAMFAEAKRYCIHDHVVVDDGAWHDLRSCWFNGFYTRVLPSDAIEMTSAFLDKRVAAAVGEKRIGLKEKQDLAAVIHLCGFSAGQAYVRSGFKLTRQRCGEHDVAGYLGRVNAMKREFARLAAG